MFDDSNSIRNPDKIGDWVLRVGIGLVFVLFGFEKFTDASWVVFFNQVGFGQGFRYLTGIVEIAGGALLLIPPATRAGAAILAATMAVASLIHVFVLHQPQNVVITGVLCVGLIAFWRRMHKD